MNKIYNDVNDVGMIPTKTKQHKKKAACLNPHQSKILSSDFETTTSN